MMKYHNKVVRELPLYADRNDKRSFMDNQDFELDMISKIEYGVERFFYRVKYECGEELLYPCHAVILTTDEDGILFTQVREISF